MIDHATIERVMETANSQITDVVSEFVHLKKRGINYIGHCPFHNEKTPSFIVSPHKGIFKCFGCGKGGNAVNFLMEHDQMSFIDAIKYLGKKFHIHIEEEELSPEKLQQKNERESMLVLTDYARKFFIHQLQETDEGMSVGISYFRQRGFRDDIITKFQLGYSPEKRDALTLEAQKQGYKLEYLDKTGLSVVRDDYKGDRFRGRVIFPIHSLAGKVIAFGGRILRSDAKAAKYLNSPESDIYHKSQVLYGIFFAKQEMTRQDRCFLVEGYTDVLSFHQSGITNVVASSGTALTAGQIRLISRFTKNVTIIYDGDPAGIKASLRGIDLVLAEGMNVKVLLLPEGDDPDSFAKKHSGEELTTYIDQHQTDFIKFKTGLLLKDAKNDPVRKAQLIQDIVRSIAVIPENITRSVYIKECSSLLQVDEKILYGEIRKLFKKRYESGSTPRVAPTASPTASAVAAADRAVLAANNPFELEERVVMRYLMKFGHVILFEEDEEGETVNITVGQYVLNELKQDDLLSVNPLYNKVLDLYAHHHETDDFSAMRFFVNNTETEVSQLASDLIGKEYELSKLHSKFAEVKKEEDLLCDLVPKVVAELKLKKVRVLLDEKMQALKQLQEAHDIEAMMSLMQEIQTWNKVKAVISKILGNRTIV
ncbi:DNA primase [Marinilabiliaceae bacterium JC017]|nr:DNA primase [Marinilabiliaceae bacterium JC017]